MELEATFSNCFPDFINETAMDHEPSSKKPSSGAAIADAGDGTASACFDCNICLSFAAEPVITLCGHLYCWPCIYRWLHLDSVGTITASGDGWSHCPVCKSSFSESSLIPLYGRGSNAKSHNQIHGIPDRPKDHRKLVAPASTVADDHQQQIYPLYSDGQGSSMGLLHSAADAVLGEMAFSVVPRASRSHQNFLASSHQLPEMVARRSRGSRRRRRMQELRMENWLHQLWVFLLCCAFLCLIFF